MVTQHLTAGGHIHDVTVHDVRTTVRYMENLPPCNVQGLEGSVFLKTVSIQLVNLSFSIPGPCLPDIIYCCSVHSEFRITQTLN